MAARIDSMGKKRVLMIASNPAVSTVTGWPVGIWCAELTHPHWEFVEVGYDVTIASPQGGKLELDTWSDPHHKSGYSASDLISAGFLALPHARSLIENTMSLAEVNPEEYDAVFW